MTIRVDTYFHPMTMTYPIQPGPFFQVTPNWGKPTKHTLPQNFSKRTDVLTVPFLHSSSLSTPWGKTSNLWTSWVYSFRPRVPSWIWIRWIQSTSRRNNFTSPSTLAISTAMQNSAQTSSYFIPGQHFLEIFMLLSHNNQEHTFMSDYIIPVHNQQTQPLLHPTIHISLRHLTARIPSQLHNYFLPSFLPSYETCIKNYHKNFSTFWFFSPLFTLKLSEEITT